MKNVKTYSAKPTEVTRTWYVLDASQLPLGRLSTKIATLLTGKGKTMFTKHVDCGDYVVVINAKDLVVTGNKVQDKKYYRHTQYPGGIKEATLEERLEKNPTKVIEDSVKGMLPVNKLRAGRMLRLKVYADSEHPHAPQNPTTLDLKESK
ncbi:50S ribosomal protein L13 [Candidatus Saccharibacteria bacterium]|nr:50S ribosomal protein L13 [Candidatus Saccharibacteria bacterium]